MLRPGTTAREAVQERLPHPQQGKGLPHTTGILSHSYDSYLYANCPVRHMTDSMDVQAGDSPCIAIPPNVGCMERIRVSVVNRSCASGIRTRLPGGRGDRKRS